MKTRKLWLGSFAAALFVLAAPAFAQQQRVDRVRSAIDRDGDGRISAAELKAAAASIRKLDANSDGVISREESTGRGDRTSGRRSGSRLGGYTTPPPANDVPGHRFNIIVGRLTDTSATIRVLFHADARVYLTYGSKTGQHDSETESQDISAREPFDYVIDSLQRNSRYFYRLSYETESETQQSAEYTFHTQRDPGSAFVFTVQADSHLDENTSGDVYRRTLANALRDQPDFHFALGDTFMTGKYVKPELAHPQYLAQRYYLGQLCHSAALYFALGNHDGEAGNRGSNVWATTTRKRYIPNPHPNDFFTGNEDRESEIGLPENYYQF
ncbi:MAG: hypothetical protein QF918_11260, partial [Pirellulaceae bacterium]|nr:hypothetical protein [Pirellulaceae bacterium]